jgi:hypothetical protein
MDFALWWRVVADGGGRKPDGNHWLRRHPTRGHRVPQRVHPSVAGVRLEGLPDGHGGAHTVKDCPLPQSFTLTQP